MCFLIPALLAVITLLFYLKTLLPGLGYTGDTAKFQFIGKVMGIPHPTGYPLYILLNKLFIQLPFGSVAFRANLMSAFFAVAAVLLLYGAVRRLFASEWIAFCAGLLFAFSPAFWSQALVAEVYTLNAFLVMLVLYLLLEWQHTARPLFFHLFLFSYAVSFGNHMTMITLLPAILFFAIRVDRRIIMKAKTILIGLAAVAVGAGQYILLYLRTIQNAPYLEYHVHDLGGLMSIVLAKRYQGQMFESPLADLVKTKIPRLGALLLSELTVPFLLIAVIGIVWFVSKSRTLFWFLFLVILGESLFLVNYDIPDISVYVIPVVLILSLFAAAGLHLILSRTKKGLLRFLLLALCLICIGRLAERRWSQVDLSGDTAADDRLTALFDNIEPNAIVATDNYKERMYVLNKIFLQSPTKNPSYMYLVSKNLDSADDMKGQIFDQLIRLLPKNQALRYSRDRRLYLVSENLHRVFRSQGIETVPVLFRGEKMHLFHRVIYPLHHFR